MTRLRVGVVVAKDDQARERVEPFRLALEEIINLPVDLFLLDTLGEAVIALTEDRVDYVRLSPSALAAADRICGCVEPLVTARPDDVSTRFYAILVARSGDKKPTLAEIKGGRLAVGAQNSIAGFRVPLANLAADGINVREYFSALVQVQNPLQGLRALMDGRVQGALAWSTLSGEARSGYSGGSLNDYFISGGRNFDDLVIVWRSLPIPYTAHTVRAALPEDIKRELRAGLLDLRRDAPDAYLAIEPDLPGGFDPVVIADYRAVLRTYDEKALEILAPVE